MTFPPGADETPDRDVIAASQTDPARFASLIDAYGDLILRYLARRVGSESAEDLAAETFLRAFRGRGSYRPVNPTALPWLYGIATNLVRDHARAEWRRLELLGGLVGSLSTDDDLERVEDAMTAAGLLPKVVRAISDLSDDARDVVVLIAVERLTYQEAAEALGVPVGTIRSRLGRARLELRRCLTDTAFNSSAVPHESDCEEGAFHG